MHLNRHSPHAAIFGEHKYGGLSQPDTSYQCFPLDTNVEDIISGELLACSDGSFNGKAGTGTFGWVLAKTNPHVHFLNAGPITGHPSLMSSYRAELSSC